MAKAGYPTIERPFDWGFTDENGQPRTCILVKVHQPGERDPQGHGQLCDIAVYRQVGDANGPDVEFLTSVPTGTRGEPRTIHFLDPAVRV